MKVASDSPATRARFSRVAAIAAIVALAGAAYLAYSARAAIDRLEARTARLSEQVASLTEVAQLLRFEQRPQAGAGMAALLAQIRFWAPQIPLGTTPTAQVPAIEENLSAAISAMRAIGSGAFGDLVEAFRAAESGGADDEIRKWLLRAMLEVDRARATSFLERALQSLEFAVSPRLRLFAADRLKEQDPAVAGKVLHRILRSETFQGLDPMRLDPELRAQYPQAARNVVPYQAFFNFVSRYAETGHDDIGPTLLSVLGRRHHHDFLTLQAAAEALGKLHLEAAVSPIKDLFEHPPPGSNPIFRNHLLDALADIQDGDACEYFKQVLRQERADIVVNKLTELIKQHCSS